MLNRSITAAACAVALAAHAGPLNPPAGSVASTPGPEPRTAVNTTNTPGDANALFRIVQPGSYYLAGDIVGVAGKNGIEIIADNVSLDLNGFALIGVPGSGSGVAKSTLGLGGCAVVNGQARSWGIAGINLVSGGGDQRVSGVIARQNGIYGIQTSALAIVSDCVADLNSNGIVVGASCTVSRCESASNTANGISAGAGSTIRDCVLSQNGAAASNGHGIIVSSNCSVINCVSNESGLNGVQAGDDNLFENVTANGNKGRGFSAGLHTVLRGCEAKGNGVTAGGDGAFVGFDSNVIDSLFASNFGHGLEFDGGSFVSGCTAASNAQHGFEAAGGFTRLSNCHSASNTSFGYEIEGQSSLEDSFATNNGGNGVSAGDRCAISRVESTNNHADGFEIGTEAVITGCAAILNSKDGFRLNLRSTVTASRASQNGTASGSGQFGSGFICYGNEIILDGNTALGNNVGFALQNFTGCTLTRSIARSNGGNYTITLPASNDIGPMGTAASVTSPWGNIDN